MLLALVVPRAFRPNLYRTIKVCIRTEKRAAPTYFSHRTCAAPRVVAYAGGAFRLHISGTVGPLVSKTLQLERDPHNHPVYLVRAQRHNLAVFLLLCCTLSRAACFIPSAPLYFSHMNSSLSALACVLAGQYSLAAVTQGNNDAAGLMTRREEARLARLQRRQKTFVFEDD